MDVVAQDSLGNTNIHVYDSFNAATMKNNLCMIRTAASIFTTAASAPTTCGADCVAAACLPNATAASLHGHACWAAGWGGTDAGDTDGSTTLNQVGVNIMTSGYCDPLTNLNQSDGYTLGENEVCVGKWDIDGNGKLDQGGSACDGDEGSPVICSVGNSATVIGVFSYSFGCNTEGNAAAYQDVFAGLSWIQETMASQATESTVFSTVADNGGARAQRSDTVSGAYINIDMDGGNVGLLQADLIGMPKDQIWIEAEVRPLSWTITGTGSGGIVGFINSSSNSGWMLSAEADGKFRFQIRTSSSVGYITLETPVRLIFIDLTFT